MKAKNHARFMSVALAAMGTLHFAKPEPFDAAIPPELPGDPRFYTHASGVAELGTAALLAAPRTRKLGAVAASALFLAVWPGNFQMLRNALAEGASKTKLAILIARLPLQLLLLLQARKVRRES
ncbi:DoxX family protein [Dermabacteraceae bacterium P7074]